MLQCNSVTEAYYDTGSYSMFEEQIDIQEVISDPSIYGSDLELQPLKHQYQQIRDQSTRGTSAAILGYFWDASQHPPMISTVSILRPHL
ncbi:hypothetical protein Patl1_10392 [Pistacia atlantica]|uniref:Uncharacterized protein n=1 Tax=Pistacia atlantica TaxID=434234 RepID=A0ACC1A6I6_9ROSI|nr:hypothetical protein Patl1_10392 [Pistacia atlantica]